MNFFKNSILSPYSKFNCFYILKKKKGGWGPNNQDFTVMIDHPMHCVTGQNLSGNTIYSTKFWMGHFVKPVK